MIERWSGRWRGDGLLMEWITIRMVEWIMERGDGLNKGYRGEMASEIWG